MFTYGILFCIWKSILFHYTLYYIVIKGILGIWVILGNLADRGILGIFGILDLKGILVILPIYDLRAF